MNYFGTVTFYFLQAFVESDKSKIESLSLFTKEEAIRNDKDLIVLRENEATDAKYGSSPEERPLKDYVKYGFIALDKPQGPTSHEVVAWVRKIFETSRSGHSGTLDPMVSGVLPVGLESATKALSALLLGPKEYVAIARIHDSVPQQMINNVLSNFLGPIYQKPPQRSSVKRVTRSREIYETDLLEQNGNLLLLRILCEAGTYIRKLIYDYGEILKVGATMAELRRTRVCHIGESDLVRLHDLYEAKSEYDESGNEEKIRKYVRPIDRELGFLKQICIRDSAVESICNGAQLAVPGIVSFSSKIQKGELVRIVSLKGELVSLAETAMSGEEITSAQHGLAAITRRVVMDSGTYPRMWKKSETNVTQEVSEIMLKRAMLQRLGVEQELPEEDHEGKR